RAESLVRSALRGDELHDDHPQQGRLACASDPYPDGEKYGALRALVATKDCDGVLARLKEAELRGMGGAGVPASMRWYRVRKPPVAKKYIVCTADGSEPETIKDPFIMTPLPHLLVEGMILAGLVAGATQGILYIRHEYHLQEEILGEEIRRAYRAGLLGKNILGSGLEFELRVFVSPGGYICGEENALIEAIQ